MKQHIPPKRWNIFARELEDIMAIRQLRLTHLDDRAFIHREKVRRLTRSLLTPKSFPILNTDEMERIIRAFDLNENEILRLRAALLATAIEQMLMDRIQQDDALAATEQIFPTLLITMQQHRSASTAISAIRHDVAEEDLDEEAIIDLALESALEAYDRAAMALHLSTVNMQTERVKCAREALMGFERALAELDEVEGSILSTPSWHLWHTDIENGRLAAQKRLTELGED